MTPPASWAVLNHTFEFDDAEIIEFREVSVDRPVVPIRQLWPLTNTLRFALEYRFEEFLVLLAMEAAEIRV